MSKVIAEQLQAGIIFGDRDNSEYIYLPGGEVGCDDPICIYENCGQREDIPLDEASDKVLYLSLKPCTHPKLGRRSY